MDDSQHEDMFVRLTFHLWVRGGGWPAAGGSAAAAYLKTQKNAGQFNRHESVDLLCNSRLGNSYL